MTLLTNELTAITSARIQIARTNLSEDELNQALALQREIGALAAALDDLLGVE